jgi:DNA-binding NarL/FixJ family response regulator
VLSISPRAAPGTLLEIAIVDDDASVRDALVEVLKHAGGYNCVDSYASGADALAQIPQLNPDLVLMDIRMPGMSGIECTRRLRALSPDLKIVMLTALPDAGLIPEALSAGATGYLAKPYQVRELLAVIQLAVSGGRPLCHTTAQRLLALFACAPASTAFWGPLTERQREIMRSLEKGLHYKEIADRLGITLFTVKQHVHHIYEKLHVHNRTEALNKLFPRSALTPIALIAESNAPGQSARRAEFIREKKLNEREVRTLDLLSGFLDNKEIAEELGVKTPLAEKILRNVFNKLNVRRRTEAVVLWNSLS